MAQKWQIAAPVIIALTLFGILYDHWVTQLETAGHDRGYMGFIVAIGVGVTLAGAAFIVGIEATAWTLLCFAASGAPMIAGSVYRHCRTRAKIKRKFEDEVREALWPETEEKSADPAGTK